VVGLRPERAYANPAVHEDANGVILRSDKREPIVNWAVKDGVLSEEHKLTVVNTLADGNCLFHSSMLGLVGLFDPDDPANGASRGLLRRMCGRFLSAHEDALRLRLESLNSTSPFAAFSDPAAEFDDALQYTMQDRDSTEPLNTFAMANALFRPIIVYALALVASPWLRTGLGLR
jgi:hypothetical protein